MVFPYSYGNQATCTFQVRKQRQKEKGRNSLISFSICVNIGFLSFPSRHCFLFFLRDNRQGFLLQVGQHASVLFTTFISIQFILTVRYQWPEKHMKRIEWLFFSAGIVLPLASSLFMTSVGSMNVSMGGTCWISTYPYLCRDLDDGNWCSENVTFGHNFGLWMLTVVYSWILIAIIIILASMVLLFFTVRNTELRAARFSTRAGEGRAQASVIKTAAILIGTSLFVS